MSAIQMLRAVLARVVWVREEIDPAAREQALEDLELDLDGWLAACQIDMTNADLRRAA
jgi:hypothetical protein